MDKNVKECTFYKFGIGRFWCSLLVFRDTRAWSREFREERRELRQRNRDREPSSCSSGSVHLAATIWTKATRRFGCVPAASMQAWGGGPEGGKNLNKYCSVQLIVILPLTFPPTRALWSSLKFVVLARFRFDSSHTQHHQPSLDRFWEFLAFPSTIAASSPSSSTLGHHRPVRWGRRRRRDSRGVGLGLGGLWARLRCAESGGEFGWPIRV